MASRSNVIYAVTLSIWCSSHCSFNSQTVHGIRHCQCDNDAHHSSCPRQCRHCIAKCFHTPAKGRVDLISVVKKAIRRHRHERPHPQAVNSLEKCGGTIELDVQTLENSSTIAAFFDMGTGCASAKYMDAVLPTESGGNCRRCSGPNKHLSFNVIWRSHSALCQVKLICANGKAWESLVR